MQIQILMPLLGQLTAAKPLYNMLLEDYPHKRGTDNQFQTPGDVLELLKITKDHIAYLHKDHTNGLFTNTDLNKLIKLHKFMSISCLGILSPMDLEKIDFCMEFKFNYPNLYQSLITWAWG